MDLEGKNEITKNEIERILIQSNIDKNHLEGLTASLYSFLTEKISKKDKEISQLRDKLVKLEAELESKFKPNKTITLQIPQARRPEFEGDYLDPSLDKKMDNISIISFRPDEDYAPDSIEEMILDRKGEKVDQMILDVLKENESIQKQIELRLRQPLDIPDEGSEDNEDPFFSD